MSNTHQKILFIYNTHGYVKRYWNYISRTRSRLRYLVIATVGKPWETLLRQPSSSVYRGFQALFTSSSAHNILHFLNTDKWNKNSISDLVKELIVKRQKMNKKLEQLIQDFTYIKCQENATIKKRKSHFNTWKKWSRDLQLHSSSAKLFNVTLFILHLRQQNASVLLCYKFITPY